MVIALLAWGTRLPEAVSAGLTVAFFVWVTIREPTDGLWVVILTTPFFLGEPKTPYFFVYSLFVAVTFLSFLLHRWLSVGRSVILPHGQALLLFLAAAAVSVPLNLRDLLEDLWLIRSLDWSLITTQGVPDISNLKYLDTLLSLGLGAALFVVSANLATPSTVLAGLPALAALVGALATFGLLRFFGVLQTTGRYLTLSFATWRNPDLRLTAVAWNPDYLAQFLVLAIPLILVFVMLSRRPWQRGVAAVGLATGVLALALTFQRAAYLALLGGVGVFTVLGRSGGAEAKTSRRQWIFLALLASAVVVTVFVLDRLILGGAVGARIQFLWRDPNRLHLWSVALRMAADHPILGVGTGRYPFFFHQYSPPRVGEPAFGPFWGTSHSLYLQILSEQGLLGLVAFALLFGSVWLGGCRVLRRFQGETRWLLVGSLSAVGAWLGYALVQSTFRILAVGGLFWILSGVVAGMAFPERPGWRLGRKWVIAGLALLALTLGFRVEAALRRPVSPGYETGFYRWERQPDSSVARWTRRRAAMTVPVKGRVMRLRFLAHIPRVAERPQGVRLFVDGQRVPEVLLTRDGTMTVEVPIARPPGSHVLVELETRYTFVPREMGVGKDARVLGVMLGPVEWGDG